MNRPPSSPFRPRTRQRGLVLIVALLVLVVTVLAAVALIRSVDVATLVSGNLAFRQAAMQASDAGVEAARDWLMGQSNTVLWERLPADNPWYFPTLNGGAPPGQVFNPTSESFWTDGNTRALPTEAGNTVRYVIHRMCENSSAFEGDPNGDPAVGGYCFIAKSASSGGTSMRIKEPGDFPCFDPNTGANLCTSAGNVYYRITVQVKGPRDTFSYVQAVIY